MYESHTAWREGDVVVLRRDRPLPPICLFTGRPACRPGWTAAPTRRSAFTASLRLCDSPRLCVFQTGHGTQV